MKNRLYYIICFYQKRNVWQATNPPSNAWVFRQETSNSSCKVQSNINFDAVDLAIAQSAQMIFSMWEVRARFWCLISLFNQLHSNTIFILTVQRNYVTTTNFYTLANFVLMYWDKTIQFTSNLHIGSKAKIYNIFRHLKS